MKKDDYIEAVLSSFKGRNKKMIKDELSTHLDDRIERFVEMGYPSAVLMKWQLKKWETPKKWVLV